MIEAHGAWEPGQSRTLEFDVLGTRARVPVRYRSALSDESGDYHNAPSTADATDQQGWPASSCAIGGDLSTTDDRTTVQVSESRRSN
jgi:hypothetical protein